jgi:hypothetical protein
MPAQLLPLETAQAVLRFGIALRITLLSGWRNALGISGECV